MIVIKRWVVSLYITEQGVYMNKQTIYYKNDEEMQNIIKEKQRNINIIKVPMYLSLVGLLLPFVSVIFDIYGPTINIVFRTVPVVCIVIGFLLSILCNKKMNDLREFIGQNIVLGILEERIQVIDYMPSGYVNESFLKECTILPNYNSVAGSDYIHGIYRNVEFTYSDLELKLESQDYTANDNNMKTTITEFSGQFITVSLSKIVNGSVLIMGKNGSRKSHREKKSLSRYENNNELTCLETGNHVFDDRFDVIATDNDLVYSILTPQFISGLKKMGKRTSIQISGNMAVIACNNEKNSFELKRQIKDNSDIELCRQEFRKELSDILAILDIVIDDL